jgi:integrase
MSKRTGIRQRGSRWVFVVDLGRDENGRRRQDWHSYPDKETAQRTYDRIRHEKNEEIYVARTNMTVATYLDEWLAGHRANVKASTWESYRWLVRKYVSPRIGAIKLQRLSIAHVKALKAGLLDAGLSPRTVAYTLTVVSRALSEAVKEGHLGRNVAALVERPRKTDSRATAWTADELRTFLHEVAGDRLYGLWRFAASTGARRGECLALRWRDIDLNAEEVTIERARVRAGSRVVETTPKSGKGRTIRLDGATIVALRRWRRQQTEERMALGGGLSADYVFTAEDGNPLDPDTVSKAFAGLVRRSGVPALSFHGLRHTHASVLLREKVNPRVVQERLGHADVQITLSIYTHLIGGDDAEASATFASKVLGEQV